MNTFNSIILYFFNPAPGRDFLYYIPLAIFAALLAGIGIAIILRIKKNKQDKSFKKLFRGFPSKLFLLAGLIVVYLFFRYYYVTFFSMRFLLCLVMAVSAYFIFVLIKTYKKNYPAEKSLRTQRLEKNKWIPKKKKRKK